MSNDIIMAMRPDGSFAVIASKPVACGCGRAALILVNKGGVTTCLTCADKLEEKP